jgi:hypothetical protein
MKGDKYNMKKSKKIGVVKGTMLLGFVSLLIASITAKKDK